MGGTSTLDELVGGLFLLGQIVKYDELGGELVLLGRVVPVCDSECLDFSQAEAMVKRIREDEQLCHRVYVGFEEGADIYMAVGEQQFQEIVFEVREVSGGGSTWKENISGCVPCDVVDDGWVGQGGWVNPRFNVKSKPYILIPWMDISGRLCQFG